MGGQLSDIRDGRVENDHLRFVDLNGFLDPTAAAVGLVMLERSPNGLGFGESSSRWESAEAWAWREAWTKFICRTGALLSDDCCRTPSA